MKLGRQMDYHGSRAYAPDLPAAMAESWVKRLGGGLAAWTKRKLGLVLRPDAEQAAETIWLVRGTERHFSILGLDPDEQRRRAAAPCPFPESEARTPRLVRDRPDAQ